MNHLRLVVINLRRHRVRTAIGVDGVSVTFPANALVDVEGDPVTGSIEMFMTPLDVTGPDRDAFPGLFEGVTSGSERVALLSHGVGEIMPMQGDARLKLAPGATATVELPLYADANADGSAVGRDDGALARGGAAQEPILAIMGREHLAGVLANCMRQAEYGLEDRHQQPEDAGSDGGNISPVEVGNYPLIGDRALGVVGVVAIAPDSGRESLSLGSG